MTDRNTGESQPHGECALYFHSENSSRDSQTILNIDPTRQRLEGEIHQFNTSSVCVSVQVTFAGRRRGGAKAKRERVLFKCYIINV